MKAQVLDLLRHSHLLFAKRDLPCRLAIYFHALEKSHLPAFADALSYFKDLGYRFADPQSYAQSVGYEKLLFVSFDDNFKNWHQGLDVMSECGARCTFYVNSAYFRDVATHAAISNYFDRINYIGDRQTLSKTELWEIADRGHTIGCHTHSHPILSQIPKADWHDEIVASKKILEDAVGQAVNDFSFPFGMRRHFSSALRFYCATNGFRTIATGISGQQHTDHIDPLQIHRTGWKFELSLEENIANLQIDSRLYAALSGRSAVG